MATKKKLRDRELAEVRKAVVGFMGAFFVTLGASATDGKVTLAEVLVAIGGAFATGTVAYKVTNEED